MSATHTAWIDGAARGNPGPASYGVLVEGPDGEPAAELKGCLGTATNNVAEYQALLALLEWAADNEVRRLHVHTDSQLLCEQIRGNWKVRHPGLRGLYMEARSLIGALDSFRIDHVRRENNKEADRLANEALDEALVE